MTVEQRRDGAAAYEWQLLVGCDPRERTYTVRFGRDDEHRVSYDRFGYTERLHRTAQPARHVALE